MTDTVLKFAAKDRVRQVADWAVFTLGALSLAVAVGATVLTKADILSFDNTAPATTAVATG